MPSKKIIGKLHLWLGLTSGLVVFIIAITGSIYAFQAEIQDLTQPYRFVEPQGRPVLPPSEIRKIADAQLPGRHIHGVLYEGPERAARAVYYMENEYYDFVYVNQYTGEVLKVKDELKDFFRVILDGHFYLWLPHEIGQFVVASATLVFVVMMISGIVLWWPKKNNKKQRFSIKWNARWRRKNYDLHNVLGFYASWVVIVMALTGLMWGFQWFEDAVYAAAGGEKSLLYNEPKSPFPESSKVKTGHPTDLVWQKVNAAYPNAEAIEVHFPETATATILAHVNPDRSTYWKTDYIYYDQYTLKEVKPDHIWNRFEDSSAADKLVRMNYDVHVGAIGGLPGKFLAFFASLVVASLPITGFLVWYGRRKKSERKPRPSVVSGIRSKENAELMTV